MDYIKPDVSTVCMGMAASMGAVLLCNGARGKRLILPNAEVMIHQPLGGTQGQATEIEIAAKHIIATKARLARIVADNCGKPVDDVLLDMERDNRFTADKACEYGLVDRVLRR